ncbi:paraquat-inducible protein A [Pseudoroseomonas cervicalis]|uniref:paraquat-inducible protein A n=1 Tax=Teichococcus cervicalis TaxID=204525 RepID=UPI0027836B2F|nr:paraquat-inducible protein A [Pseudoroseomonas cervicalis]MDQ1077887.1 paraquat-inducible protein A [Pseudoroseomonas cervicalis]
MSGGAPPLPAGTALRLRQCDDCGLTVRLSHAEPGVDWRCPRCDAVLRRHRESPLVTPLALAMTALIFCIVTLTTPFLTLRLLGQMRVSHVESGAYAFAHDGLWLLAALLVATIVLVPLLRLSLRLAVLGGLSLRHPPPWLPLLLRAHERLAAWSMLEVFLFGALVSYTRLADLAEVEFGPAVYSLGAVVLAMVAADAAFEPQAAWDAMEARGLLRAPHRRHAAQRLPAGRPARGAAGEAPIACHCCHRVAPARPGDPCERCGTPLHPRKPRSLQRAWALIIAAAILYVPANYYPVMTIVTLGQGGPHTILGGVVEFVETGFWPLGLIVFLASVAVPMLKLVGLAVMLVCVRRRSAWRLAGRTRLYRIIEVLGRWSMIDVFVVAVLIALVRFGVLASINAEIGAACFGAVVILTMLAAEAFDPRLMWDAAGQNAAAAPSPQRRLPDAAPAPSLATGHSATDA